nr:PREDICTED: DNA repair-scaffolding protein [Latimeria chalumnae]|eukprot:XP_014345423.1 PREDICTED: DNA repair-scaffolding protein [Latimeria chalumnae]
MNTYFSQKVLPKDMEEVKNGAVSTEKPLVTRKAAPSLAQVFLLTDRKRKQISTTDKASAISAINKVSTVLTPSCQGMPGTSVPQVSDSLLEVIESQGPAGLRGVSVRVIVQRVYCLPVRDSSSSQLLRNNQVPPVQALNSGQQNARLGLLVQDAYGIFSEVQLLTFCSSDEELQQHTRKWEGKSCYLTGMKVLQRTTRGRSPGLFSLIDSLWPPLAPLKVHGRSQDSQELDTCLSAPSFCYVLSPHAEEGCVEPLSEDSLSALYLPPVVHTLRDILQVVGSSHRCSFSARVVYRRPQIPSICDSKQREWWWFVTESSLQSDPDCASRVPRVVPVCITAPCLLGTDLISALNDGFSGAVYFKDAVRQNDTVICAEHTVLSLQQLSNVDGVDLGQLSGPVKLDGLDSTTKVNTLCTVKGTVVGVDESTSFSWPTCNRCGSGKLERSQTNRSPLYCCQCSRAVTTPVIKMQLEVFMHCPSRPHGTIKVKLLQGSISALLMSSSIDDGCYEVDSVLGKEVGPLSCYVRCITSQPTSWIGIEEICLL